MNKKERIILLVVILIAIIICVVIAIKNKDKKENDTDTKDDNNIYNIKVEQKYSKSKNKFTIIFSNVKSNLYIKEYGQKSEKLKGNSEEKVIIENLEPGSKHLYIVNDLVGRTTTERKITIELPYYNEFYSRTECEPYRKKLKICSSQFLNYKVTEDIFENTFKNYNTNYDN